jgi:hypothetical protein
MATAEGEVVIGEHLPHEFDEESGGGRGVGRSSVKEFLCSRKTFVVGDVRVKRANVHCKEN